MSRYKAIVIDGKKIIRRTMALCTVAAVVAVSVLNIRIADVKITSQAPWSAKSIIEESLPAAAAEGGKTEAVFKGLGSMLHKAMTFFLTFDPFDPRTVVFGHLPLIKVVSGGYLAGLANQESVQAYNPHNADRGEGAAEPQTPQPGIYPITEVDSAGGKKNKIQIRNETGYSINVDEMLKAPLGLDMKCSGPKILIVHTHATESYSPEGAATYYADKSDRNEDPTQNVIAVGDAMETAFKEFGIEAIHDKTLHDMPSYNTSYANSLKTVEAYLAKYPSIQIVLDIHRDAFVYENGSKAKFVTEIEGKKTAQLMLVVGTNAGGLDHAKWRENMKLALKLQNAISQRYPGLMRGVNIRRERFNGHTTTGSMIIEVGSSGNTLSEAIRGATLAAQQIANYLKKI